MTSSFVGAVAYSGAAPCWCVVSGDGRALYVTNTGTNSVGVYSLADPLHHGVSGGVMVNGHLFFQLIEAFQPQLHRWRRINCVALSLSICINRAVRRFILS